jgi:hypothetical protein
VTGVLVFVIKRHFRLLRLQYFPAKYSERAVRVPVSW